ncbi:MAG TPA: Crp/Fnr family transcriptional regulator [Burkholderiales bacterium]|nr:Crp/Fnr family transcriptional regulator [Burkholderiales bacterium]
MNSVLAALPPRAYAALEPSLQPVSLAFGQILCQPGQRIAHVYFPQDSLVSLLTLVDRRFALEVGLVGFEGMVGMPLALGNAVSPVRALVQGAGSALRMPAPRFLAAFGRSPPLRRCLFAYLDALLAQITQTAACNRFHVVEARLARWLLMTSDRVRSLEFRLTQEFLAHMLGVRRAGVSEAASALQRRRLIVYRRGAITILDRRRLAAACSCYRPLAETMPGRRRSYSRFTTA